MNSTKGLMSAVIIMGILIVVCLFVVILEITKQGSPASNGGFASSFEIPKDASVLSADMNGKTMSLLVKQTDGAQVIYYFDRKSGKAVGSSALHPTP